MGGFENLYKLNTRHDIYHIHKLLGALAVAHFIWRFWFIFRGGAAVAQPPAAAIFIHLALTASSYIYRVPRLQNTKSPIINEQFRKENLILVLRSVLCFYCHIWWGKLGLPAAAIALILTPHAPDFPMIPPFHAAAIKYLHFVMAAACAGSAAGGFAAAAEESSFVSLFPIQMMAFLLTLSKKGIITNWIPIYYASVGVAAAGAATSTYRAIESAYGS